MAGAFLLSDIDGMLRLNEFAVDAVVVTGDVAGTVLRGVFDAPYSEPFGVAGSVPTFVVKDDCERPRSGDRLEIDDLEYRIRSIEPDSTGVLRLELNEV